jgi:hypothetical protein
VVLTISVTAELKSETVELCHLVTDPTWPLRVRVVLFVPVQTAVLPAILPPEEVGLTVKDCVLVTEPLGVVTCIVPLVPEPTVAVIWVELFTVYETAVVPPKLTAVVPVKLVPVIVTVALVEAQTLNGVKEDMVGGDISGVHIE